jgi:hypothetical protein
LFNILASRYGSQTAQIRACVIHTWPGMGVIHPSANRTHVNCLTLRYNENRLLPTLQAPEKYLIVYGYAKLKKCLYCIAIRNCKVWKNLCQIRKLLDIGICTTSTALPLERLIRCCCWTLETIFAVAVVCSVGQLHFCTLHYSLMFASSSLGPLWTSSHVAVAASSFADHILHSKARDHRMCRSRGACIKYALFIGHGPLSLCINLAYVSLTGWPNATGNHCSLDLATEVFG